MKYSLRLIGLSLVFGAWPGTMGLWANASAWLPQGDRLVSSGEHALLLERDTDVLWLIMGGEGVAQALSVIPLVNGHEAVGISLEQSSAGDRSVEISFGQGDDRASGLFALSEKGILSIDPSGQLTGIRLGGDIRYAMLPGIFLEDIVYDPSRQAVGESIVLPSERVVAGFLGNGEGLFAATWEENDQSVSIMGTPGEETPVQRIEIGLAGEAIHIGLAVAPKIWICEKAPKNYTEEDVAIEWKRPFAASWRTGIYFNGMPSDLEIESKKVTSWRGYHYPVWFEGEDKLWLRTRGAFDLMDGVVFAYPFSGDARSLNGLLEATPQGDYFKDLLRKRLPYSGPGGAPGVGYTACWGTDLLRETLLVSESHLRDQAFVDDWIDSVVLNFVIGTQGRRTEHHELIVELQNKIENWKRTETNPGARAFLDAMTEQAKAAEGAYSVMLERDGHDSPEGYIQYVAELGERLKHIIRTPGTELAPEYDYIVGRMNHVTWAHQEHTGGRRGGFGHQWRLWFQQAGLQVKVHPEGLPYAEEIRNAIRKHLAKRSWETLTY